MLQLQKLKGRKMDSKTYLERSKDTAKDPTPENVNLEHIDVALMDSFEVSYAGHKADMLKRMIYYKDGATASRYSKGMSDAGDLYDETYLKMPKIPMNKMDLLHGVLGIASEAGELHEALVKSLIEKKEIDKVNIMEECGDVLWYVALLLRAVDSNFEEAMQKNITKLEFRKGKFVNRDTAGERKILEA